MEKAARLVSKEYRIYLALWRKAYREDETVTVRVPNLHMGVAMKQGMYRAIRPFRHGELEDDELVKACEKYVVYFDKENLTLEFRERKALSILEAAIDDLGIDESDLLYGQERVMKESLDKITKPLKRHKTKFY